MNKIIFLLLFAILCSGFAYAGDFEIHNVDGYVNGVYESDVNDNDKFPDVKAGDEIKLEVEVENNADLDLEDAYIKVTVEDLEGAGNDYSDKSSKFDIDDSDTNTEKFSFTIPTDITTGKKSIKIYITGDDNDGSSYSDSKTIYLYVNKPTHDVQIKEILASPSILECGKLANIYTTLKNAGSDETVELALSNYELSLNQKMKFTMIGGEQQNKLTSFTLPLSVNNGDYTIKAVLTYAGGTSEETATISVRGCTGIAAQTQNTANTATGNAVAEPQIIERVPVKQKNTIADFVDNNFLVIIVVLFIILIGTTMFALMTGRE